MKTDETNHLVDNGSIDDIRNTLCFLNKYSVEYLTNEIEYEKTNRNRSTVIKMLKVRLRQINKRPGQAS